MSGLVFYAPPVAPLLPSSSSSNLRCYKYSGNERHVLADLSGDIVADATAPTTSGGITDVWKCTWFKDTGSTKVAVKTFRIESTSQGELARMHKARTEFPFSELEHENILPLYGIVMDFGPTVSIVHPWKENGTLSTYLSCKHTTLTVLDRFKLLENIVSGLHYLHSHGLVHGNLSGNHVLVDAHGRASLADPGLSVLVPDILGMSYFRLSTSGAIRFAAPELFKTSSSGKVSLPSISSDSYSLGSIIYLVLSGSLPYSTLKRDGDVLVELLLGVAPASSSDSDKSITREQWQFIQGCWSEIPENRRSTNEALEFVDVNLVLYIPFRAISLTEVHSRSSKTEGSKPRLALSRRDFSPGDPLPLDIQASLAVGLRRSRDPRKAAEAAVSVILNDIFDISHVVPQWDSKETENVVVSHTYNVLVEDIKMIGDALRVLQTSNPNSAVERSLGTLRSTIEQLLFDEKRKQREPRSAFMMIISKLQDFLNDLWKELYGNRGKLSAPFWEWFEKWMAMMRAWDNSQSEAAVHNTATCLRSILS
ncbi:kinase-like domain-containing protein [Suillus ampliporus]|nr:kinase-like domain-containing protein [Suillus ampliporus]